MKNHCCSSNVAPVFGGFSACRWRMWVLNCCFNLFPLLFLLQTWLFSFWNRTLFGFCDWLQNIIHVQYWEKRLGYKSPAFSQKVQRLTDPACTQHGHFVHCAEGHSELLLVITRCQKKRLLCCDCRQSHLSAVCVCICVCVRVCVSVCGQATCRKRTFQVNWTS